MPVMAPDGVPVRQFRDGTGPHGTTAPSGAMTASLAVAAATAVSPAPTPTTAAVSAQTVVRAGLLPGAQGLEPVTHPGRTGRLAGPGGRSRLTTAGGRAEVRPLPAAGAAALRTLTAAIGRAGSVRRQMT